jgi:predicted RNA-binding protein with PIN domain
MKVLIDALNLIYKFPDLALCMYEDKLDSAKDGLIQILKEVATKKKDQEFIIFIDGKKTKGDLETFQEIREGFPIYYSHEKEADDLIREFIKENPFPNRLTLVTSDKKILQFARHFKVKTYTSDEYSDAIRSLFEQDSKMDPDEKPDIDSIQEKELWEKIFIPHQ